MDYILNFALAFGVGLGLTTVPLAVSYLIIFYWMKSLTSLDPDIKKLHGTPEFIKYIFSLNASKGLSSQGLFWLSILVPFCYFLALGAIAWQGYVLRLDAEGFKTFTSISALPLGVLSLMVPLSVSVARFHASKQTARQIEIVSQKNNIDLYHSHRKELFSFFDQVGERKLNHKLTAKNKVHPRLHKTYFQGVPVNGMPIPRIDRFEHVDKQLYSLRRTLISILTNTRPDLNLNLYVHDFCFTVLKLSYSLGLQEIIDLMNDSLKYPCVLKGVNINAEIIGDSSDDAICAFKCIENFFQNLCDFANYEARYFNEPEEEEKLADAVLHMHRPYVIEEVIKDIIRPAAS